MGYPHPFTFIIPRGSKRMMGKKQIGGRGTPPLYYFSNSRDFPVGGGYSGTSCKRQGVSQFFDLMSPRSSPTGQQFFTLARGLLRHVK